MRILKLEKEKERKNGLEDWRRIERIRREWGKKKSGGNKGDVDIKELKEGGIGKIGKRGKRCLSCGCGCSRRRRRRGMKRIIVKGRGKRRRRRWNERR